jgi:hypothetical protein
MTNNNDVITLALTVMPVLACCFIADGLNAVQGAVLRGSGRQWWTAGLNVAGWWGVGVPLAYYLAIVRDMNVPGEPRMLPGMCWRVCRALWTALHAHGCSATASWRACQLRACTVESPRANCAVVIAPLQAYGLVSPPRLPSSRCCSLWPSTSSLTGMWR